MEEVNTMSPYWIGGFLGAFVITGLLSRILEKYVFKRLAGIKRAVLVLVATLAITLGLTSLTMGLSAAVPTYIPAIAVWFIIDVIRAVMPKRKEGGPEGNPPSP